MSKIFIMLVSKDTRFSISDSAIQDFYAKWPEYVNIVKFKKISNNMMPLPELYNNVLDNMKYKTFDDKEEYDFVVFMHADVSISLIDLVTDIERCKDKYDVMGLCGCAKISTNESPLNWFCGSNKYPQSRWGCVTHGEAGNQMSYFSMHSPDVKDHSVACIDGLCIIISKHAADVDLRFGTEFTWDQYDTDLSFSCVIKHKLRLGVLVEKSLHHYSIGKSILTNQFLINEIKLRKKWDLGIPKGSKLEQIILANPQLSA